jgi:phage FluMu protein Com
MSVKCPRCKDPLYVLVETSHTFLVEAVAMHDIVPGEKINDVQSYLLKCENCKFSGWTDEYHEEANGIIRLFKVGDEDAKNSL